MRTDTIRFATYAANPVYLTTEKTVLRSGLNKRVQRFAVWLGNKLGIFERDYEKTVSYDVAQLDMRRVIDEVAKHKANIEQITSRRAKYLIVGRDQMDKLRLEDMTLRHLGKYPAYMGEQYADRNGTVHNRRFYYDLEVLFVPYIDGCFVLPDLESL